MARIKLRQSYLNKEYIYYLLKEILPYCDKDPYRFTGIIKGRSVDEILIATKWFNCFTKLYSIFYNNKLKRVPFNIYDLITPLVLFHWVTGAGIMWKSGGRGLILYVLDLNVSDIVKLINVLIIKYSINSRLLVWKSKCTIYIYRSSLVNLIKIIEPIMATKERSKFWIWNMLDAEVRRSNYIAPCKNSFIFNKPQRRTISTSTASQNIKLNPWFVTGFTDAEGCFEVYLVKNDKRSSGGEALLSDLSCM